MVQQGLAGVNDPPQQGGHDVGHGGDHLEDAVTDMLGDRGAIQPRQAFVDADETQVPIHHAQPHRRRGVHRLDLFQLAAGPFLAEGQPILGAQTLFGDRTCVGGAGMWFLHRSSP